MNDEPKVIQLSKRVWSWYKKRPQWLKVLLFVFIIAFVGLLIFFNFLRNSSNPDYLAKVMKEKAEEALKKDFERIEKKDKFLEKKIKKSQEERKKLEEEREKLIAENKDAHEKINDADSIDDVDDILSSRR